MIGHEKFETLLYRLIQGETKIKVSNGRTVLYVKEASISSSLKGCSVYENAFNKCLSADVITEEQMIEKMISENLWTVLEQEHLDSLPKKLEDAKVNLYLAYKNFRSREPMINLLKQLNEEYGNLTRKRGILYDQTCEGFSNLCKTRYLICSNTFYENGEKFLSNYENADNDIVSQVVLEYLSKHVNDKGIRELSKQDIWKSFWGPGKSESGVFNKPSIELTSQQRSLITWSKIYDSVANSPESPPEAVIKDDDMFDGWLIYQNRKSEKDKANKLDSKQGANVKGDEVFLFADTKEDARRIHDLNDSQGKANIRSLNKQIDKSEEQGKVLKTESTVEAQLEMRQMANEQFKQKSKGN